ncbi:Tetracycline transcriptional regulator, TetR-related, C-terminal [Syntrophomonas zehnderi OL-4]|uniref:Tetracycline transcriptional regulator, TetR-related, C-terminal n=1 Tax=Syntrophomonas zehnderi OL-4 TaxID=690567 RepID=A0A0E4C7U6_9FIRM|nr:TetR/AcrR family transcriptional regulator [Syntrophomonas zehnderi]CFX11993.1 Tetracycline transcriptional regulator, TetR-related, C-terminal [Syntrophomonas zehnderi OL-4]
MVTKRDMILEAGIKVFSQKGYHHAKMEDIAVAAGIGKGTIYEYFSSKLQLFQEIMEAGLRQYQESVSTEKISQMGIAERIQKITAGHFYFCQNYKELSRILFWDTDIIDDELKDWFYNKRKEKEGVLEDLIRESIRSGELREVDAKLVTLMIGGILGQIWMPIVLEGWEAEAESTAWQITDLIMNGIVPST